RDVHGALAIAIGIEGDSTAVGRRAHVKVAAAGDDGDDGGGTIAVEVGSRQPRITEPAGVEEQRRTGGTERRRERAPLDRERQRVRAYRGRCRGRNGGFRSGEWRRRLALD